MPSLYTRVARRAEANEMPITEAGAAEIDRWLKEERGAKLRRRGGAGDAGANRGGYATGHNHDDAGQYR